MIPIKLGMRNFMCYRDNVPPLSFDGIHTVCICGDNGNGKSALIDAVTWALWGKARAKGDDDLIHQGQAEMEVEFDFAVGEQPYRIIRKHSKPRRRRGSGQTILEFQMATGNGFRSISGNSVSQTQQKIIDILHMGYDTFKNSAYLRQGHADEFTLKRPGERKEVLADILELSFYDQLEEQAKNLAKEQEMGKAQLESIIKDISDELAHKPVYEDELEQAQNELSRVDTITKEQESRLSHLRQEKEALENRKLQLAQLEEHITKTERELKRWDDQTNQHLSRLKEYEKLITQRSIIEEGYARFTEAKKLDDELDHKFRLVSRLNERKYELDISITKAGQQLLQDHAIAQNRITELEAISQKLSSLRNELQQMQVEWKRLAEVEETLRQKRQINQELRAQVHQLEANKSRLEKEIEEIAEKLNLLATQSDAKCPLCETELGTGDNKSSALKSNQTELVQKKLEMGSLESEVSRLEAKLGQDRALAQGRAGILNKEITEAEEASNKLREGREKLAEIEQHLARR